MSKRNQNSITSWIIGISLLIFGVFITTLLMVNIPIYFDQDIAITNGENPLYFNWSDFLIVMVGVIVSPLIAIYFYAKIRKNKR